MSNYKLYNNVLKMLEQRNYKVNLKYKLDIDTFKNRYSKNKDHIILENYFHPKIIYFIKQNKIKPNFLKEIFENYKLLYPTKELHFIFIFKIKINSNLTNVIKKYKIFKVEVFIFNELIFNITSHKFVPKHEFISDKEFLMIQKKYNLESQLQLPKILKSDPISKYYGAEIGQIFRITRLENNGYNILYRYVTNKL